MALEFSCGIAALSGLKRHLWHCIRIAFSMVGTQRGTLLAMTESAASRRTTPFLCSIVRDFSLSGWRKLTRSCLVKRALDQKSDLAALNFVCQL